MIHAHYYNMYDCIMLTNAKCLQLQNVQLHYAYHYKMYNCNMLVAAHCIIALYSLLQNVAMQAAE